MFPLSSTPAIESQSTSKSATLSCGSYQVPASSHTIQMSEDIVAAAHDSTTAK
jgi:hypothetical protein